MSNTCEIEPGAIVAGRVLAVYPDEICVSLDGGRVFGHVNKNDLSRRPADRNTAGFNNGDPVEAVVLRVDKNNHVKLSIREVQKLRNREVKDAEVRDEEADLKSINEQAEKERDAVAKAAEDAERQNNELRAKNDAADARRRIRNIRAVKQIVKVAVALIIIGGGLVLFGRMRVGAKKIADGTKLLKTPKNVCINGGVVILRGWEGKDALLHIVELGPDGTAACLVPGQDSIVYFASADTKQAERMAEDMQMVGGIPAMGTASLPSGTPFQPQRIEDLDFRKPTILEIVKAAFAKSDQK